MLLAALVVLAAPVTRPPKDITLLVDCSPSTWNMRPAIGRAVRLVADQGVDEWTLRVVGFNSSAYAWGPRDMPDAQAVDEAITWLEALPRGTGTVIGPALSLVPSGSCAIVVSDGLVCDWDVLARFSRSAPVGGVLVTESEKTYGVKWDLGLYLWKDDE